MMNFLIISNVVLWVLVILQAVLFFGVIRQVSQFLKRFQEQTPQGEQKQALLLGQKAPLFSEADVWGQVVTLNKPDGRATLLVFSMDTCTVCQEVLPELPELTSQFSGLRVLVVKPEDRAAEARETGVPEGIHLLRSNSIMENYQVQRVPFYVLVNPSGLVVSMNGFGRLSDLVKALKGVEAWSGR